MDKSGSNNNPKKSVCLAQSNSSKIRLAPPKTVDWAIGTLEGCKRKRCCGVALDADVYFHTAHEYFKAFTKCREAKAHSDAKLKLHEQRKIELVEKVCMLQAAFSHIAQEKEALRAENVLSGSANVKLRSKLHEQQALGGRLQANVQALADDMRDLQKQVRELHVRCAGFQEEVEVKEVEINKLRSSLEQKQCKQLSAVVEQKHQQCNALDVPKIEANPKAVVRQDVREPALLASKRRSEERDEDGEITIIGTAKRSKSSETTPVTAAAAPPLNSSNSATIDQPQMPVLEQFWRVVKQNERAVLRGWTNASALVDQFMLSHTPCIEQPQHKQAQMRAYLLNSLPPCPTHLLFLMCTHLATTTPQCQRAFRVLSD